MKQALTLGIDADSVVVHKEHHTSYYPGAENVTVMLFFDRKTGVVLGGQTAGYKGADKRLDVIAIAAATHLTIRDLADVDFAYAPPIGTANDALNMAAYAAENKMSGFSPSVTVSQLDAFLEGKIPVIIDLRDYFAFEKNHVKGALHIPVELLVKQLQSIPLNSFILVYDETGKKGHQAVRILLGAGMKQVFTISGGFISLQRQACTTGFKNITIDLLPIKQKSIHAQEIIENEETIAEETNEKKALIVDVRTIAEYKTGAYPEALNIPLDELGKRYSELGTDLSRDITVYCLSGGRSAYAQKQLQQLGYTNVKNGGGINTMMAQLSKESIPSVSEKPLIIDVRTTDEFSGGAFPGAINIPLDSLQNHLADLGSLSREITVYCASGGRSSYARSFLLKEGFTNVTNGGGLNQMMMLRL